MEPGFLAGVSWWRGAPDGARDTKAFWGPKLRTEVYEVLSFRCLACGHLELRTGDQTGKPGDGLVPA
jgi:hypothetical protein